VDSFTEDEAIFRTLQENWPDLRVYNAISWNMRRMERGYREELPEDSVPEKAARKPRLSSVAFSSVATLPNR